MKYAILIAAVFLASCASPDTIVKERIVTVNKPVFQPCVGTRPDPVKPLMEAYSNEEWAGMSTWDRWRALGFNALEWASYGQTLQTETAACPESTE